MAGHIALDDIHFSYPGRSRVSVGRGRLAIKRQPDRHVLRGVSIEVSPGQVAAVIGRNGCGKSTLVKIIAGILQPSRGTRTVDGRLAGLVELGAGFDAELSVHDNVLLYGSLLGNSVRRVRGSLPAILDWADLRDVEWAPVRTLSSGMVARLGFSVATHFQPDVLLIDEVLAVGDADFQDRSATRIADVLASGCSVLMVTHDMVAVREMADVCYWIDGGDVRIVGDPMMVTTEYMHSLG